jgi:hypothetical protein
MSEEPLCTHINTEAHNSSKAVCSCCSVAAAVRSPDARSQHTLTPLHGLSAMPVNQVCTSTVHQPWYDDPVLLLHTTCRTAAGSCTSKHPISRCSRNHHHPEHPSSQLLLLLLRVSCVPHMTLQHPNWQLLLLWVPQVPHMAPTSSCSPQQPASTAWC